MTDDSGKQPIQRKSRKQPRPTWWRIAVAIVGLGGMIIFCLIFKVIEPIIFNPVGFIEEIIVNSDTGDLSQGRPISWSRVIAFLAALGILWGSSIVLDARSAEDGWRSVDMPWLRTVLGAGMGTLMVLSCWSPGEFGLEWFGAGALAGAFLGWLGFRWAQIYKGI